MQECIDNYEFEAAQRHCQSALELDSDSVSALELTAQVLIELGDTDGAKQVKLISG